MVWRFSRRLPWRTSWISERKILVILNLNVALMPPVKFQLNPTCSLGGEFRDGVHFGYQNELVILNLYVSPMPPAKFRLTLTYHAGADVVWRFSRWPPWWPSWISKRKDFSNSESLCRSDASHQDSAQSNLQFWRRCHLKTFKMDAIAAILDIGTKWF